MSFKTGCLLCGDELVYNIEPEELTCNFCGKTEAETVKCTSGHFICNSCHSSSAMELIHNFCRQTELTDPIEMANIIMRHQSVKMHGPEHHYLVPAVLIAAYYNLKGLAEFKSKKLSLALKRAEKIPGGFCGSHGNCGAGVGTGVFLSVITDTTPLSEDTWKMSNLLTGTCLVKIAEKGGPRCCKRDTYTAITHAAGFIKDKMDIEIPASTEIECFFHPMNKECLGKRCEYFPTKINPDRTIQKNN